MDEKNPSSEITMRLHACGWSWNFNWSWTDRKTGKEHTIENAIRIQNARL